MSLVFLIIVPFGAAGKTGVKSKLVRNSGDIILILDTRRGAGRIMVMGRIARVVVPKGSQWPHAEWVECLHRQITYLYPAGKGSLGS